MRPMQTSLTGAGNKVMPVDYNIGSFLITVDVTGTVTFTVNLTNVNILGGETALWFPITALTAKAADTYAQVEGGATAFQLVISAGTGTAVMTVSAAGGGML